MDSASLDPTLGPLPALSPWRAQGDTAPKGVPAFPCHQPALPSPIHLPRTVNPSLSAVAEMSVRGCTSNKKMKQSPASRRQVLYLDPDSSNRRGNTDLGSSE